MNPVQLASLMGQTSAQSEPARIGAKTAETATTQDRLWQQAMRQAQQRGFAGWFASPSSGVPPTATAFMPRREPDQPADPSPSPEACRQPVTVSAAEVVAKTSAVCPVAAGEPNGSTEGRVNAPSVGDCGSAFAQSLQSAFARPGTSVSVGSGHGGLIDATAAPARSETVAARAIPLSSVSRLLIDERITERTEVESIAPSASAIKPSSSAAPPADPLRVHAEWSNAGVRIWLAADAGALDAAHALAGRLQEWLGSRGERLLSLVCNGRVWSTSRQRSVLPYAKDIDSRAPLHGHSSHSQEVP